MTRTHLARTATLHALSVAQDRRDRVNVAGNRDDILGDSTEISTVARQQRHEQPLQPFEKFSKAFTLASSLPALSNDS